MKQFRLLFIGVILSLLFIAQPSSAQTEYVRVDSAFIMNQWINQCGQAFGWRSNIDFWFSPGPKGSCNFSIDSSGKITLNGARLTMNTSRKLDENSMSLDRLMFTFFENDSSLIELKMFNYNGWDTTFTRNQTSGNFDFNSLKNKQITRIEIYSPRVIINPITMVGFASAPTFYPKNHSEFCPNEMINFYYNRPMEWMAWEIEGKKEYNNSIQHAFTSIGSKQVKLFVKSGGNYDTIIQNVIIINTAKPNFNMWTAGGSINCPNDEISFSTNLANAKSYEWSFGDDIKDTRQNPTHAYLNLGTYNVTVKVTNLCNQSTIDTNVIYINNNVDANANFNFWSDNQNMGGSFCPQKTIRFNAYNPGRYFWEFGDGGTSTIREAVNNYADTGVKTVRLTVVNGCGKTAINEQPIHIKLDTMNKPCNPWLYWEMNNMMNNSADTIRLCPNEAFTIDYEMNCGMMNNTGIDMIWNFNDGTIIKNQKSVTHSFTSAGVNKIELEAKNQCGGVSRSYKYVVIDNSRMPNAEPGFIPREMCVGEGAYFFDNKGNNDPNKDNGIVYRILFGDGDSIYNVSKSTDTVLGVLANHKYLTTGKKNIYFEAKNKCGNKVFINDTISIINDVTKKPFYYVSNSTVKEDGPYESLQDWSRRHDPTDHEFILTVKWTSWQAAYDSISIYFWPGQIDTGSKENNGGKENMPAGMVTFKPVNITSTGDIVKAYIPMNPMFPGSMGIAAVWWCSGGNNWDNDPAEIGVADSAGLPKMSFKSPSGGSTSLGITMGQGLFVKPYSGICLPRIDYTTFEAKMSGTNELAYINFFQMNMSNNNQYEMYYSLPMSGTSTYNMNRNQITRGSYFINGDTITMNDSMSCMGITYQYRIVPNDSGSLALSPIGTNNCSNAASFISSRPAFTKSNYNNNDNNDQDRTGCPNDNVLFKIAGGVSRTWHFYDGATSSLAYPKKQYINRGVYKEYAVSLNSCGRTDTVWTTVKIDTTAKPNVWINVNETQIDRAEPITFTSGDSWNDQAKNYKYSWDFGDGTAVSTVKNPSHTYNYNGTFKVKLTTTNGCGTTVQERTMYVSNGGQNCMIMAKYEEVIDSANLTVTFTEQSYGTINSYYWNFGDGKTSTMRTPVHVYDKPGIYNVCLSILDTTTKCSNIVCKELIVGALGCRADYSFITNNSQNTVVITNKTDKATQYFWTYDDGFSDTIASPTHKFSASGYYNICLNTFDKSTRCRSQKCSVVMVGDMDSNTCLAEFSYAVDPVATRKISFTGQISGIVSGSFWDMGDGTRYEQPSVNHLYTKDGVYNVCMNVYNATNGCQSKKCKEVVIGQVSCKADFSFSVNPNTRQVVLSDKSIGKVSDYYWEFADGAWADSANPTHIYAKAGNYKICLHTFDASSKCVSDVCKDLSIKAATDTTATLAAKFNYFVDQASKTITLSDKSTGKPSMWYWTFGDGSVLSSQNPSHTYLFPGVYDVCLYIFNSANGQSSQICQKVTVGTTSCNLTANFNKYIDNNTKTISLTDASTGDVDTWFWNFGDGKSSSSANPKKTYTTAGYYLISLAIRDNVNNCADYTADFIQIGTADCKSDFTYTVNANTRNASFTETAQGTVANYFWMFGDGYYSMLQDPSHIYTDPDMYNVSLTISQALCMDYIEKDVQVGDIECNADFTVCVDSTSNTAYFNKKTLGSLTNYYWVFGDGTISTAANPVHKFNYPGYYVVSLNVYNKTTKCMDANEEPVMIGAMANDCEADFVYMINAAAKTVNFTDKSKGTGLSYKWNFGDSTFSTSANPVKTYVDGGIYNVCLMLTNGNSIDNISCKTIRVDPAPVDNCIAKFDFTVDTATRKVAFTDKSQGGINDWYWEFGDAGSSTQNTPEHTYSAYGLYVVHLKAQNTLTNCVSNDVAYVNVGAPSGLAGAFWYQKLPKQKASGYPVDFVGIAHGDAAKLKWTFGDGTEETTTTSPKHIYADTGTYNVCISVYDQITGEGDTTCQLIRVGSSTDVPELEITDEVLFNAYPNPFSSVITIRYEVLDNAVELGIYDINGKLIERIINTQKHVGRYALPWDGSALINGTYWIKLTTGGQIFTTKIIKE